MPVFQSAGELSAELGSGTRPVESGPCAATSGAGGPCRQLPYSIGVAVFAMMNGWMKTDEPEVPAPLFPQDLSGYELLYSINDSLMILDLANGEQRPFLEGGLSGRQPQWSSDAGRVVFTDGRTEGSEVFTVRSDGSELRQLTNTVSEYFKPKWSPDGTQIVFVADSPRRPDIHPADDPDRNTELWLMNSDGSELRHLTENDWDDWHPGGHPMAIWSFIRRIQIEVRFERFGFTV